MIGTVVANEWRAIARDGRGRLLLALGALLAVVSVWTAASIDEVERAAGGEAMECARERWLEREVDHPHSRAHFGDYLFRPAGPLAGLDSGVQAVTGRVLFTEAHRQNAATHRPQAAAGALLRFDRLEPAMVLVMIVPLLLGLLGFASVSGERESGRLRLLLVQGGRPAGIVLGKTLALWTVGAAICLLVVGAHLAVSPSAEPMRAAAFCALHLVGLWIVAALVVTVSALVRRTSAAASLTIGLWMVAVLVVPRIAAQTSLALEPLPTRDAFEAAMRHDRDQGLDGHDPRDERRVALEKEVLAEYGVSTKEELPIDIGGIVMQADEEYGNKVWDTHFGRLEETFGRQSSILTTFALANPLLALDAISTAMAGTDLATDLAFQRQAERYRRDMVAALNHEHAYGGARPGLSGWKPDPEFYAGFEPFTFDAPALGDQLARRSTELVAIAVWVALSAVGLWFASRTIGRGGAA
ncbi:MAG: DUF3526 domain-containing protein [Planctomycetota bacterium JB042]